MNTLSATLAKQVNAFAAFLRADIPVNGVARAFARIPPKLPLFFQRSKIAVNGTETHTTVLQSVGNLPRSQLPVAVFRKKIQQNLSLSGQIFCNTAPPICDSFAYFLLL